MPHDARGEDRLRAEQAADRYAEATAEGGLADIEALCAAHPELAGELRRLHERQARWGGLVAAPEADRELDPD
ncbi:MAG: hypothetical protein RL112_54, partial [Planctomycetota bacterium]